MYFSTCPVKLKVQTKMERRGGEGGEGGLMMETPTWSLMNVKNQSVSVWMDTWTACSSFTTSTDQASSLTHSALHWSYGDILGCWRLHQKQSLCDNLAFHAKLLTVQPLQMKLNFGSSALYVTIYSSIKKEKASRSFASIHLYKVQVHESQRLKRPSVKRRLTALNKAVLKINP